MEINQLTIGAELNHLSRVAQGKEPEVIDPADSLSYDYLQPSLMRLIENLETVYQADRSYIVGSLFAAASGAVGKLLKSDDGKYINTPCLWIALIGRSGSGKSEPLKQLLNPILSNDAESYKIFKTQLKDWKMQPEANENEKPQFRKTIINDSTPESRYKYLENNDLLMYADELKVFFDNIGRYTRSGELAQLLSIWDGRQFCIDRKSDEPSLIQSPFMSICGSSQPEIIRELLSDQQFTSSGFVQRMLFVYPDSDTIADYKECSPDTSLLQYWSDLLTHLHNLQPATLRIVGETKEIYVSYYDELQEKKRRADDYTSSVLSKLQIYAQRWTILIHALNGNKTDLISAAEMEGAIRAMRYFESTSGKLKNLLTTPPRISRGELLNMLRAEYPNLNQSELARSLGITQQAVNKNLNK